MSGTVLVPQKLLTTLLEAQDSWAKFTNKLENFLLSQDEAFIAKMKRARTHHRQAKTKDWATLKVLR